MKEEKRRSKSSNTDSQGETIILLNANREVCPERKTSCMTDQINYYSGSEIVGKVTLSIQGNSATI